ncbi:MAG: SusD/RagB family nutrient-binding outer membrane lipoprotein, partial [Dysgonamonadaceae bacterium]|nr:SusD/RagB family nutrient-binding outer membrane lipoprotein [Dysgonamonadaceae bacterium]
MKSKLLIIFSATIMLFTAVSCSDWLDVNHDPNALEQIPDAKVLLPAAEIGIANNLMGWDFGFAGAFWVEYWTQSYTASQFKTLTEYLPQEFNTTYQSLMREPLTDLKRIKTMTAEDENKGYYFIAEALSIFTWQIITDVWGDMPYTEALRADEGILHPVQDKGQDIYADLMTRVDALLAIDLSESSIDSKFDYIYEGDLDEWYRFASS